MPLPDFTKSNICQAQRWGVAATVKSGRVCPASSERLAIVKGAP